MLCKCLRINGELSAKPHKLHAWYLKQLASSLCDNEQLMHCDNFPYAMLHSIPDPIHSPINRVGTETRSLYSID